MYPLRSLEFNRPLTAGRSPLREVVTMSSGIGVLTNGGQWWIYNLALRDEFPKKLVGRIDVLDDEPSAAAHVLNHWLGRLGIG